MVEFLFCHCCMAGNQRAFCSAPFASTCQDAHFRVALPTQQTGCGAHGSGAGGGSSFTVGGMGKWATCVQCINVKHVVLLNVSYCPSLQARRISPGATPKYRPCRARRMTLTQVQGFTVTSHHQHLHVRSGAQTAILLIRLHLPAPTVYWDIPSIPWMGRYVTRVTLWLGG